ncbi:MAG: PilN domain-containing protein [Actinomycetota bacterium]
MSQVNLLPPEILQGQKYRRSAVAVLLGGVVLLVFIFAFYLLQIQRLSSVEDEISAQQLTNAGLLEQIAGLQEYEDLKIQAEQTEAVLASAYENEVSFSALLLDLSRIMPSETYLQNYSATVNTATATTDAGAEPSGEFVGNMSMGGQAIGIDQVSLWLTRLEQVKGWVNPWVSSVTAADETIDAFSFTSTVDLTNEVVTERGQGEVSSGG